VTLPLLKLARVPTVRFVILRVSCLSSHFAALAGRRTISMSKRLHPAGINKMLDVAAIELGHITMAWGRLEHHLDEWIAEIAMLDGQQVSEAITGNLDIRGKIQVIKALAFIYSPSPDWRDIVISTLDKIDNDLRVRRNTYIHAGWYTPKGKLRIVTKKTKLLRPQSFQLLLETTQKLPVRVYELRRLNADLMYLIADLHFMLWYFMYSRSERPQSSRKISFSLYLRRAGYGIGLIRAHLKPRLRSQS
jgi:hypothetical protein